ncbi:DsbE family thiol:disulfide interchange protein [Xanthomonas hyacinthi]|uniref:DsbE family thiol:disulfide interchange protein n=1 Tax=Xanthomonas hyacinthi TaxID=56455 RepID=A0A2S7EVF0_9XANT|nr:DsbE family thiol:disulfide interchange protein [Xanthomonas hyacinthi]KLD79344.1 thiol:disulfide interchange protein [Xanthomonas hyacinthi DSM 19077]PPU97102.1 DsbE family thiol:disulfide interchange protein [Xanthomonas hyacinthi]QGY78730.1 DsbE family thiol:disulfide interchange protein [Xanthomonas hyacinthi]
MSRLLPLFGFLLLAALFGFGIYWSRAHDPRELPSPLIGKPAPAFSLPRLDHPAQHAGSADLRGRPYLLNVFGSWCLACGEEHPVLLAHAHDLDVALVGYAYKDDPRDARSWLEKHGNPYALVVVDQDGQRAIDFGVYGAPETFLIDAQGVIRYKHVGALTPALIADELRPAIAALGAAPR